jgi:hypothetical protein
MSWTQVVKDWNKTKVIKDDSGVYALPIRGGDDYKDVRRIYDKIKKKQAKKEIEADKKLQKKIEVKKPVVEVTKPVVEVKKADEMKPSKDVYYLYHYDNKDIPGLHADLFKGKEKREYLKKVFDKVYPGNKGLTSLGYSLLTADLGPGSVGIKIFQKDDGKVEAQVDYDVKEGNTDRRIFTRISNEVYGDRIEEIQNNIMAEEQRYIEERNKKFDDELKVRQEEIKAAELIKRREKAAEGLKKVASETAERNKQRKREAEERKMMAGEEVLSREKRSEKLEKKEAKGTITKMEAATLFEDKYVEGYEFKSRKDMAIAVRAFRIALPELTSSVDALAKFFMKRGFKGSEYEMAFRKGATRPGKTFVQDALNNRV